MYERFTDRSRKVMQLANQEAKRFGHEFLGPEHLLLGLVKEGAGVAATVLKDSGLTWDTTLLAVSQRCPPQPTSELTAMGKLAQTPQAKKVIEYAIEEARTLSHNYVGTEHLLLGLLRDTDGVTAEVLFTVGNLTPAMVRAEVLRVLQPPPVPPSPANPPDAAAKPMAGAPTAETIPKDHHSWSVLVTGPSRPSSPSPPALAQLPALQQIVWELGGFAATRQQLAAFDLADLQERLGSTMILRQMIATLEQLEASPATPSPPPGA